MTDKEPLIIQVFVKDPSGESLVIGRWQSSLRDALGDQLVHDEWLRLEAGSQEVGSIHLSMQWIYSEVEFCRAAITTFDEAIKLHEE
jgi:Ca2+-dependent lipid-binding protein